MTKMTGTGKTRKKKMTNKYDAVLYDLDGTLIDSVPVIVESAVLAYERVFGHCDRTGDDIRSYIGRPLREMFIAHGDKTADKLTEAYLDINMKMLRDDKVTLFPDVKEDLLYLKSLGIKQGIMTSKKRDSVSITLGLKGMDEIFDTVICFDDTSEHKPSPEPLIRAARDLGVIDMSRVLYVGDAIPDAECARNAGSGFALVSWSEMDTESITGITQTIRIGRIRDISCIITECEL